MGLFRLAVTVGLFSWAGHMVYGALQARWSDEPGQRPARERVFAVNVVTIQPETLRPVLSTFGEVRARRTLEIRAATGGAIVWLADAFEEGGTIEAGAPLVRIDPADAESALATARADLSEARADLAEAERALALADEDILAAEDQLRLRRQALARQQDLSDRGVGSAAAVETAELAVSAANQALVSRRQAKANATARVDQASTALERREISLAEADRRLADTEISAEFAGVLSEVGAVVGGLVSPNERLADLIDPTALELAIRVSTPQYSRLLGDNGRLLGADVTAAIDILGVDLTATGQITRESPAVSQGQTGRILFAPLTEAPGFRPGDFVSVRIEEPALEAVARLPASAVDAAGTVLLIAADDRLEVGAVEVLRREGDDVIVRANALNGREIVAERTPLLGAGIRVRPIRPDAAAAPEEPEMLALDPERRARLVAFVEGNQFMPADVKDRVLAQLQEEKVPAQMVERIESRMGG